MPPWRGVLFDLDGTLVDSAPDLAGAANEMRIERGLAALPYANLRPMVGTGARGMVGRAFGAAPGDPLFEVLRTEFLDRYERRMTRETRVFEAVPRLLETLTARGVTWGIVTNKAARFSEPLVQALGMLPSGAVLVSGDTTPHAKPHPAPLLEAASRLGIAPDECVYVGDDQRDVVAGRAAGMGTMVAAWGYLGDGEPPSAWGADHVAASPAEVLKCLGMT